MPLKHLEYVVLERIFDYFNAHGYDIKKHEELKSAVQTASDFGVPQKRNRVIIVGIRRKDKTEDFNLEKVYSAINRQKIKTPTTLKISEVGYPCLIKKNINRHTETTTMNSKNSLGKLEKKLNQIIALFFLFNWLTKLLIK